MNRSDAIKFIQNHAQTRPDRIYRMSPGRWRVEGVRVFKSPGSRSTSVVVRGNGRTVRAAAHAFVREWTLATP